MSNIWNIVKDVVSIGTKIEKMNEIDDEHLASETQDGYDFNYGVLGEKADYRSRNRSPRIGFVPYQVFFLLLSILLLGAYFGYKNYKRK